MNLLPFMITVAEIDCTSVQRPSYLYTHRDVTYCGWGSVVHRDRCIACFGRPFAQGADHELYRQTTVNL